MDRNIVLRQVMTDTGTTQSRLAELSGVKQPSISQMLSGRIDMSDEMLERLLSCMGYGLEVVRRPIPIQLDRSTRRRWLLHTSLVPRLSERSLQQWTPTILRNLKQLRKSTRGEPHVGNLDRWQQLVASGDVRGLKRVMTSLDTASIQMREVSPLGGLVGEPERLHILKQLRS